MEVSEKDNQPFMLEAEQAVLGSLIIEPEAMKSITPFLKPEHFYLIKHRYIYQALLEIDGSADLLTLSHKLETKGQTGETGGDLYLMQLTAVAPTALHALAYARIVEEYAIRRMGIGAAQAILKLCLDEAQTIDQVTSGCVTILDDALHGSRKVSMVELKSVIESFMASVEANHANPELVSGVPTGFTDIDKLLGGGAHRGELIIVAGRPGIGKTSLLNAIALNASGAAKDYRPKRKHVISYSSLEMSREELVNRFVAAEALIDSQRLRMGNLEDFEWDMLTKASMQVSDAPIFLDDSPGSTVEEILANAAYLKFRHGLDAVLIDYLGLLGGEGDAYERVSSNVRKLKNGAKKLDVSIFCACQLSRACEAREDKRPKLSDLRDAGEIEQAADVVMMVYRDEYYNGNTEYKNVAEIAIAKNRNGPIGVADLFFDKHLTKFGNLIKNKIQL